MISQTIKIAATFLLIFSFGIGFAQYLSNPSFEGTPQPDNPPPGWSICTSGLSTPDTQPGNFGVFLPPSNGNTYLGMTARLDNTWEDVQTTLITPLSKDSCYIFQIDLAFQENVSTYQMDPITLKIYGGTGYCDKSNLIWQSPAIGNEEWQTFEFPLNSQPDDITNLVLEAYYLGTTSYWGYILMDNINIIQSPSVDLGNDTTLALCENDSLVLNAGSGYAAYLWSDGSQDTALVVDSSGVYWVQVYNQYGCSDVDSIEVTIEDYIPMSTQLIDSTYACAGQMVSLTVTVGNGAAPYFYYWEETLDTVSSIIVSADTSMFFHVEITDKCGNTVRDSIKIVILPAPEIDLGEEMQLCSGDDLELSAGPGYVSYLWQDGSTDSVLTVNEPGWYWVEVMGVNSCTATDSVFVSFYPPVEVDIGNDTVLCEVTSILLDAGNDFISYLWQDGSTNSTYNVENPGIYWVVVSDENGCEGVDSLSVDLSPAVIVNLGGDTTVCSGDDFYLSPGPGFTDYLWNNGSTSGQLQVNNPGLYWVVVTDVYGCTGSDSVFVGLNPSPVVSLGADTTICTGENLTLMPGSFSTYLWQDNSSFSFYEVYESGLYEVTVSNTYGCEASDEIYVEVTAPEIDLGEDTFVCEGDSLLLDPGQGYSDYIWQDGSQDAFLQVNAEGMYSVVVTDVFGCSSSDTVSIELLPYPPADIAADTGYCKGSVVQIELPEGPFNYYWNGISGSNSYIASSEGLLVYSVQNACGESTDTIFIEEWPVPQVDLGEDIVLLEGESIQLDAGAGNDTYLWQDGSNEQYNLIEWSSVNTENPYYQVEVTLGNCQVKDSVKIVFFNIKIPLAFSPNGDQKNDVFKPFENSWSGINKHTITVFNRWGEKVWESQNFPSGWDGKRNGNPVAEGTYFWVLEVFYGPDDINQRMKGTVTLLGAN